MRTLHRAFAAAVAALALSCTATVSVADGPYRVSATSRIKDLANIEGVRQNQLIGYGLVVGLNNTGDTLKNAPFTQQALQTMLERWYRNAYKDDNLFLTMARRPGLLDATWGFIRYIYGGASSIEPELFELVRVKLAWNNQCVH